MKKEIPWFSARRMNVVSDYSRFHHSRSYFKQRSALFPGPASNPALMRACGYRKAAKFARHRAEWDALQRNVPLSYLEAIGVDIDVLAFAAEVDMEEFRAALELPFYPTWGIERAIPGFYCQLRFPPGTSEAEAISMLLARAKKSGHEFCVKSALKAVYASPDGSVETIYFKPRFHVKGGFLVPRGDGSAIGTVSLG